MGKQTKKVQVWKPAHEMLAYTKQDSKALKVRVKPLVLFKKQRGQA